MVRYSRQKENYIWCFGNQAGLDFNTTPATAFVDSMIAHEGVASMADKNGNLLFYTNGLEVWDRTHHVMPNGSDLLGGFSSTEAALILPLPNSSTLYYLFVTEDQTSDGGLSYSVIDMTLNGGLGDIVSSSKNTLVVNEINEQVTAVLHCNGIDSWIITHLGNSNEFLAYSFTEQGLNPVPVISAVGSHYPEIEPGPIKASHRGLKLVSLSTHNDIADLLDVNSSTGEISNAYDLRMLFNDYSHFYGIEFSPNDSLLYLTWSEQGSFLYQIDLSTMCVTKLTGSDTLTENFGALQLGPDNQIYMAAYADTLLDVIHHPDKKGFDCLYEHDAIPLAKNTFSRFGLPNSLPYLYVLDSLPHASLGMDTTLCIGNSIILHIDLPPSFGSAMYVWNNGSTSSTLTVDSPGVYWVSVQLPCESFADTIQVNFISCEPIVSYDLEGCSAYMSNGSNMDYSEFVPAYPNVLQCAEVTASNVFRSPPLENKHSCTPGIGDSIAMCISSYNSCTYVAGQQASLIIEVTIKPDQDSVVSVSGLEFYEKAPPEYNWIDGGSGSNNYPKKYGLRILKNGMEIFRDYLLTRPNWTRDTFNFLNDDDFIIEDSSLIRFELLPYCPVGNGADVSAWDIDAIKIFGKCVSPLHPKPSIAGEVLTPAGQPVAAVKMQLSVDSSFPDFASKNTDESGLYEFDHLERGQSYYVRGYKNDEVRKGVSTLDLLYLRRHLLGLAPFTSLHQYIAADVNHSGSVTAIDLLELRKLLLGIYTTFPNNTSWRFGVLPQDMNGSSLDEFRETCNVESLDQDTLDVDFVGIKIGDINGDIQLSYQPPALETRSDDQMGIWFEDQETHPGIPFSVQIKAGQEMMISGIQLALDLNGMELISFDKATLPIDPENYSFIDGLLRISWSSDKAVKISPDSTLFNLVLRSASEVSSGRRITLAEQIIQPEAYTENLDVKHLGLHFEKTGSLAEEANFLQIEPNPVTSVATIHFNIVEGGLTQIRIFDLSGKVLMTIKKNYPAGEHWEKISGGDLSSAKGIIFCQLVSSGFTAIEKVVKWNGR